MVSATFRVGLYTPINNQENHPELAALTEDLDSTCSTHMAPHNSSITPVPGYQEALGMQMVWRHMQAKHPHHIDYNKEKDNFPQTRQPALHNSSRLL